MACFCRIGGVSLCNSVNKILVVTVCLQPLDVSSPPLPSRLSCLTSGGPLLLAADSDIQALAVMRAPEMETVITHITKCVIRQKNDHTVSTLLSKGRTLL